MSYGWQAVYCEYMKKHPIFIGLLLAIGVAVYVALISALMYALETIDFIPPMYVSMIVMLTLLVLSAAVTGSLVFTYPVLLAIRKKTKEALLVFASTLVWLVVFIILLMLIAII